MWRRPMADALAVSTSLLEAKPRRHVVVVEPKRTAELAAVAAIAVPALLYATGFVVVSAAEDRLGIASAVTESFRARSIQAGFFCAAFVGLFGAMGYLGRHMEHHPSTPMGDGDMARPLGLNRGMLILVFPVLLGLYVQQTIGTPRTIFGPAVPTLLDVPLQNWLFLAYVVGMIAVAKGVRYCRGEVRSVLVRRAVATLMILGVVYFLATLVSVRFHGWTALWRFGFYTFLMIATAGFMGRIVHVLTDSGAVRWVATDRRPLMAICVGLLVFLYYMLASAYAAFWFPFISVRKGGCDFSTAAVSTLRLEPEGASKLPLVLRGPPGSGETVRVVVLLETVDAYFVAPDVPERGRWGKLRGSHPPVIFRLDKSEATVLECDNSCHGALSAS